MSLAEKHSDAERVPERDSTTRAYSRRFHNIYLYITERCQLRCGHCYMGDRLERGQAMSFEKAAATISYMNRLGAEYLTFVGGEPTLHPDLPRMVKHALDAGYRKVMLDSNGLLVKRIQQIPPESLFYVRISLDGASPETHDKVRGSGNFDKTIDAIKLLTSSGYTVRITSTIFRFNIHEAFKIISLADELGVRLVNFHTFSEEGNGVVNSHWSLKPEDWIEFYESLTERKEKYKAEIRYPPTWATPKKAKEYAKQGFRGCLGCSLDRLSIFPDGRCYVCSVLFDQPLHFATLTEKGLVLNRQNNEYELFTKANIDADDPSFMGCPAETVLEGNGKPKHSDGLISMCRLWRTQV
jgi:MoaA/NifB/PqqE/SkfB family radical SAM enzyme